MSETIWTLFHRSPGADEPDRAVFATEGEALEYLIVGYGFEEDSSLSIIEEMQRDGHVVYLEEWRREQGWECVAFMDRMRGGTE